MLKGSLSTVGKVWNVYYFNVSSQSEQLQCAIVWIYEEEILKLLNSNMYVEGFGCCVMETLQQVSPG